MKNLKLCLKLFFKNKVLLVTYILLFVLANIVQLVGLSYSNIDILASFSQLQISLRTSIFYFAFFAFLSCEYFYKAKKSALYETLSTSKTEILKFHLSQLSVLMILNLFMTLIYILYNIGAFLSLNIGHNEFLLHILTGMLLNFFLIATLAIIIGMLFALVFKRIIAYLLIALFIFLTSPIFEKIVNRIFFAHDINLFPICDFFNLYTPSLYWTPNFLSGYSILPHRFMLILIWIFALSAVLLYKLIPQKVIRNIIASICVAICAVNIFVYFQPSSKLVMNNNPNGSLLYDHLYYTDNEQKNEPGGFYISAYTLDINVTNILNVNARLQVSENLPEYRFTLYRGYGISSIFNQDGVRMEFDQEGDYFIVYNNSNVSELIIEYSGFSQKFYSNSQGMVLPGFFPYFPLSGFKKVYIVEEYSFDRVFLEREAEFEITVTSRKSVYSNLSEVGEGEFRGTSTSVTLVSGFVDSRTVGGIRVIYPYLDTIEFSQEIIDEFANIFIEEYHNSHEIENIIILPSLNLGIMNTVMFENHITARNLNRLALLANYAEINPRKLQLNQLIETYLFDIEMFGQIMETENSEEYMGDRIAVIINEIIEELGIDAFLQIANEHIIDDSDTRTIIEFLNDLKANPRNRLTVKTSEPQE